MNFSEGSVTDISKGHSQYYLLCLLKDDTPNEQERDAHKSGVFVRDFIIFFCFCEALELAHTGYK